MDQITQDRINKLHPKVREEVRQLIEKANAALTGSAQVRIVQGLRTFAEQDGLYALGRTKVNPDGKTAKRPKGYVVTNARGGQSIHNYGLAIDFALLVNGKEISWDMKKDFDMDTVADWMEVVKIFEANGWEWGGRWQKPDNPHFGKKPWLDYKPLLDLHNQGKIDSSGYVLI